MPFFAERTHFSRLLRSRPPMTHAMLLVGGAPHAMRDCSAAVRPVSSSSMKTAEGPAYR